MLRIRRMLAHRLVSNRASRQALKSRPVLESLESRVVLYTATGNAWPVPQLITISFAPDGTNIGGQTSNLFSSFNANPKLAGQWQSIILKAAQNWAQQTNINFAVVPDNGAPQGGGSYQQGQPGYGDIRIGGYNFNSSTLGEGYLPPPVNNFDIAGDVAFNTGQHFSVNSTYDLFTVAAHEIGHALGLGESTTTGLATMYGSYNGVKNSLNADDISGIRSIYGGSRQPDAYNSGGLSDGTFSTATNLNSLISPTALTGLVSNLDLNTVGQVEDFMFNAPSGTTGNLTLNVQSSGLSLLSPSVTVYASNQTTVLGSASGLGQYGTTLTVSIPNVTANEQFYVKVTGADSTSFSTGDYAMTLNFGSGASPTVPLVNNQVLNGNPIQGGGGLPESTPDSLPHHHHHHVPHGPHGLKHHEVAV